MAYKGSGEYNWASTDAAVNALVAASLEPCVHIQNYIDPDVCPTYPTDPTWYCSWVTALVNRYKDRIHRWAIENETTSIYSWSGTVTQYFDLLELVYPVIKAADPDALVFESCFGSCGSAVVRAKVFYDIGDLVNADAIMQATFGVLPELGGGIQFPPTITWEEFWLQDSIVKCLYSRANLITHIDYFDGIQRHWYAYAFWFQYVLAYFKALFPNKTHESWEIGHAYALTYPDDSTTEYALAKDVARSVLLSIGAGCTDTIYFPYIRQLTAPGTKYHPGLCEADGTQRMSEGAYRRIITAMADFTSVSSVDLGAGVCAYRFTGRTRGDLYAVWAQNGSAVVNVPLAVNPAKIVSATDGATRFANPASLTIQTDPLLVEDGGIPVPVLLRWAGKTRAFSVLYEGYGGGISRKRGQFVRSKSNKLLRVRATSKREFQATFIVDYSPFMKGEFGGLVYTMGSIDDLYETWTESGLECYSLEDSGFWSCRWLGDWKVNLYDSQKKTIAVTCTLVQT